MGAGKALRRTLRTLPKKKKLTTEEIIEKYRDKKNIEESKSKKMASIADKIVEGDPIDYSKLTPEEIKEAKQMIKERDAAVKKMRPIERRYYHQMMRKKKKE